MNIIDVIGKPCPIPVIESKKALATGGIRGVMVKVDNYVAVQNLEKMAKGLGYEFSFTEITADRFDVYIGDCGDYENHEDHDDHDDVPQVTRATVPQAGVPADSSAPALSTQGMQQAYHTIESQNTPDGLVVTIGRDAMGDGEHELGKVLIKGFIYALSELPVPPECVVFYNSGAFLTAASANTIDDLKKLGTKGTKILTCGTCVNFYSLQTPAVGEIANMYDITEKMANARKVINI